MKTVSAAALLLALASQAATALRIGHGTTMQALTYEDAIAEAVAAGEMVDTKLRRRATYKIGYFDQLIDHSNPSLGTFKQRYWWDATYYAGPGSPVSLMNIGETAGDRYTGYLTNRTVVGMTAQPVGGAMILLEHRYWGESSPFANLSTANMRFLTLNNSIADNTRFAREVVLPFDPQRASAPSKAPWVFIGGSYPGALAAWIERLDPGTFWAYYASSAVVEAVGDFWRYYSPVQQGMPQNCSADVRKVVEHVDRVLQTGSPADKLALKSKFGFADIEYDDDFASALAAPISWQSDDFATGYSSFYNWCDYVENAIPEVFLNATNTQPTADGVGLDKALEGYAMYTRDQLIPGFCDASIYGRNDSVGCWSTRNLTDTMYTDLSVGNSFNRQWFWMVCNEPFKWWQGGAPQGEPTIASRLITTKYNEDICARIFPAEVGPDGKTYSYGTAEGRDVSDVNSYTKGGWLYTNSTRVLFVNGEFDPWRDATVSSVNRPGGPLESTDQHPVLLVPKGIHCADLVKRNGDANQAVAELQRKAISTITSWIKEFPGYKNPSERV